jgi:hypothetical protein
MAFSSARSRAICSSPSASWAIRDDWASYRSKWFDISWCLSRAIRLRSSSSFISNFFEKALAKPPRVPPVRDLTKAAVAVIGLSFVLLPSALAWALVASSSF